MIQKILVLLLFFPVALHAQYASDWIKPGQIYYRILVAKKGVYRITYDDLLNAGFPLSADPRTLQIFHRGQEQSIYVEGQSDAVLNSSDFIEFFGQANDGTLDKDLYKPASSQPHQYYNLYSDTTAYFLTWNPASLGRRVEIFDEANVLNIPKEAYQIAERLEVYKNQYAEGFAEISPFDPGRTPIRNTIFDQGEGWTGTFIQPGGFIDYQIDNLTNRVAGPDLPQLEILLVGRDQDTHGAEVLVGPTSGALRSLGVQSFADFQTLKINFNLQWSDISSDGKLVVRLIASATGNNRPQFSASYIKVNFPQNFQAAAITNQNFTIKVNPGEKSFVEFENAPANFRLWDVTNPSQITAIATRVSGSNRTAIIPGTSVPRTLHAFTSTIKPALSRVSFRLLDPSQSDFIIISHRALMNPAAGYSNPVKAYAEYRASEAGGGYDTLVMPVDLLYNQFNYGEISPRAIFEFMRYMTDFGNPKYLFLIGKGRDVWSGFHRQINGNELKDLVPTAGNPGSDISFTAGLKGTIYEPAVPTGRITATTPAEVVAYLNKIKEYESAPAAEDWQKRGLHLSGGINLGEAPFFRFIVDGFKTIGEGPYWGGKISTISKREPTPIELINISDQVNKGVNLVTFFGHSSPYNVDIDIGKVSDPIMGYNNPGKYPTFLINGCNVGSVFLNDKVFGEDWINTAGKGARNFVAHSSFAFTNTLQHYSTLFYQVGLADSLFNNKGIGDVQKEVAKIYMSSAPNSVANIAQVQQMLLLGDPSVKLYAAAKPDYQITNSDISISEKIVTALTDSFSLKLVVHNKGVASNQLLKIRVLRTLDNGSTLTYDSIFNAVFHTDTLFFKIKKGSESAGGNNSFVITLDPLNSISELNENNNEAIFNTFISANSTLNLFPINFGLVNKKQVTLTWQDSNPFSETRDYRIELDTTRTFNSPFLKQRTVSAKVLARTEFEIPDKDSTVYYWRTRFSEPQNGESAEWMQSSFSYIKNSLEGWAQLRRNQWKENQFDGIIDQGEGTSIKFEEQVTNLSITTFGSNNPAPYTDVSVRINGFEYNLSTMGFNCRNNTINLIVFNKTTAVPYLALPFGFYDLRKCGREPQLINSFRVNELETAANDDLIEAINRIGISDSVVLFSIGDAGYPLWSDIVKNKLGELGINTADLNSLQSGEPVIIFGKKGASVGSANIIRTAVLPVNEQVIGVAETITGRKTEGKVKTPLIGPANQWNQLNLKYPSAEASDEINFQIYGVDISGSETLLELNAGNGYDLNVISAEEYPYLRLAYFAKDEINLTPADWKNWVVTFEPAPEGILLYDETTLTKTVQEGEEWSSKFSFTNISTTDFKDSLDVKIELYSNDKGAREFFNTRIAPPLAGKSEPVLVNKISTLGKSGPLGNDLVVLINDRIKPELYYENNLVSIGKHLIVIADKAPPVLTVTFDDRILRNEDFVSSNPKIEIKVKDENPFLLLTDTTQVNFYLTFPCEEDECSGQKRIPFNSPFVKWYPATTTTDFKIEYTPQNLQDGKYLLTVEAKDASGNASGTEPYELLFNVKSESTLSFKGVYPNPSSTGFTFGFELTGNVIPEKFLLEIFSPTGQLVTQFNEEDVMKFYTGTNEIVWEGIDSSGAKLSSGIYLYRLTVQVNESEKSETGKLVWIR